MPVPLSSYKTPGVYVQEIQKLPPSIAQVETAVPVFIGYTQKAERDNPKDLQNVPTKIRSQGEYENLFGTTNPEELHVSLNQISSTGRRIIQVENASDTLYRMYYAIQMFYANGGGEAFVISVGDLTDPIKQDQMEDALEMLKECPDPTILLFPDAVDGLSVDQYHNLMKSALLFCADPKINNSFTIMDVKQENGQKSVIDADVSAFRNGVIGSIEELKYGAAYYPYLETTIPYTRTLSSVQIANDKIDGETAKEAYKRLERVNNNTKNDDPNKKRVEKELLLATTRKDKEITSVAALKTITDEQDLLAPLLMKKEAQGDISRVMAIAIEEGEDGAGIQTAAATFADEAGQAGLKTAIEAVPLNDGADPPVLKAAATVKSDIETAVEEALKDGSKTIDDQIFEKRNDIEDRRIAALPKFREAAEVGVFTHATLDIIAEIDNGLLNEILAALNSKGLAILPPSSAMAGAFARVDNSQGVHKAPANIGLAAVSAPHRAISDEVQDGLNVDTRSGKSINVIRTFKGIGTLVWGARTLAGNDREWKYIPVRRFFNMVEESTKRALFRFVFEPNNPNTWTSVRASIEAFLETQWRAGALLGNTPNDAYFVRVGVPETFSEAEMLDGFMVVEIGMAVVRPAEFIVLKFMHKFELGGQ